ncbi:MAG TPA: cysteine--tRNA ligase [Treponemataceae bacterium]|jgi:cysteinyl-tRNA synthetase|nr:cysteine--tRNA ligase [Treponema sp.]OQB03019.1 MAG: Cysteine--tRNA ligase [Spirochaetes bacterium ADurb.Bin215]HOF84909.1 cysteine--tRNA ligase [Treponemataceae bacterium]HOS35337.1 cysteine--tRNA ligase [Treponemataceae bacterium]HPL91435.1 cysteine--tRNA ligase [Treponemataceae bacterium]
MSLELYNTMGRSMQKFTPRTPGKVGFYGCGPTVYNYAHIGNLRAFVFQDTLARSLRFLGYEVTHVMNVTDIGHLTGDNDDGEDKMVNQAREKGQSVLEVAEFYTKAFFDDIDRLNILRPTVMCKATDHVDQMIRLIQRIEANGHTYSAGGNLYFDISTFPGYGALANFNPDDLKAGTRVDIDENKRNPFDFVLWFTKSKFENQALVWDSPWGRGYPGWHIECSAMSMEYLGEQFDIHTGGIDHIQIHHTNEIAQSEGATGKKWVNYWLHNEFLVMDKGKMSKSSGEFLTLQYLIDKGFDPLDYRFFLLGGHYRSQLTFSWESMESARNSRRSLVQRLARITENAEAVPESLPANSPANEWIDRFRADIEQDLSTPRALSQLQGLIRDTDVPPAEALAAVARMDQVLGLDLIESAASLVASSKETGDIDDGRIDALIAERTDAKKAKNFSRADEIRNQLKESGIILEDTASGTTWRRSIGEK